MTIGEKLKDLRKKHGLSQVDMSRRIHMEQSNYSKYESNKRKPTIDIIERIAQEFKIPVETFLQNDKHSVIFENGSINQGALILQNENYYAVPKEMLDTFLHQQKTLTALLEKVLERK